MAAAVKLRTDYSASDLRRLAAASKHANQSRRLLSLAAVLDGMGREQAARIGGMDRQTLRDWVHRFNQHGPDGLRDIRSKGHPPRLSKAQLAELAELVETGPDRAVHGVVRWRRIDLKKLVFERFGVGAAAMISKAGWSSLMWTRTSPPFTSLPNRSSSASGRLIVSWITRASGRAP